MDEEKYGPPEPPLDFSSPSTEPEVTEPELEEPGPPPNWRDWLTPIVYKGISEGRADSEETVSCERCESSYPASAPGETGLVPTIYGIVRMCVDCAKKWF
jgi:hypothetical protein